MTINISFRWFFLAILFFLLRVSQAEAFFIELTRAQVQEAVEQYFPIRNVTTLATFDLHQPLVFLEQKSNRIGLAASIGVDVYGIMQGEGRCRLDGDLEYRQATGEFFLHDPQIVYFAVDNFPPEINSSLQQTLQEFIRQSPAPIILVYKLQDDNPDQRKAKNNLSAVTVGNGKLIIELLPLFPDFEL